MARDLKEVSATGDVTAVVPAHLFSVSLTGGTTAATLAVKDGSGGATRLTLKAAIDTTVTWLAGSPDGVQFGTAIHATFTGTGPLSSFEYD